MSHHRRKRRRAFRRELLLIEDVALTGEGIAKLAGKAVFVPGTLLQEEVEARVDTSAAVWRAELLEVTKASAKRVEPPCRYASPSRALRCGGCDWMHIARDERERLHRRNVGRELAAVVDGQLVDVLYHRASDDLGYRARARWSIQPGVRIGYRAARSHRLVEIEHCAVLRPEIAGVATRLRDILLGSRGEGDAATAIGANQRPVIELHWRGELDAGAFARAASLVAAGELAGVRFWPEGARAPLVCGDPRPLMRSANGHALPIAVNGFSQASVEGGAMLARRVAALVGSCSGRLVELFAGSGILSLALAPLTEVMLAVEQDELAAEQLRANLRSIAADHAKVRVADANAFKLPKPTQVVVLDPPRAGAAGACATLTKVRPRRIVYVSCNPATLTRDLLTLLPAGYRLTAVELFDLFPQTSHVETVVKLERS